MRRDFGEVVTGPFLSVEPEHYNPSRIPSVLYVGKALGPNEQMPNVSVRELRGRTAKFLGQVVQGEHRWRAFWNFAVRLSSAVAQNTGHARISPLQNLVWTNICKIGDAKKNPARQIYETQKELAIATLKAEIAAYRPALVFWVTGNYKVEVVRNVVDDIDDASWVKDLEQKGIYWRAQRGSLPPMIWTYHPERKSAETWRLWIERAVELVDGAHSRRSRD